MWISYMYSLVRSGGTIHRHHAPVSKDFVFRRSECSMMIPGTFAEMHKDYD